MTNTNIYAVNTETGNVVTIGADYTEAQTKATTFLFSNPSYGDIANVIYLTQYALEQFHKAKIREVDLKWSSVGMEEYTDNYEALPPARLHFDNRFSMFMCSEAQRGDLHRYYVHDKHNNKCYTALTSKHNPVWIVLQSLHGYLDH